MPYDKNADLPQSVKNVLPEHAQAIYREAFNHAMGEYDKPGERQGGRSQEETAHAVAWSAVKKEYEKDDKTGKWVRKGSEDNGHSGHREKEGAHTSGSSSHSHSSRS